MDITFYVVADTDPAQRLRTACRLVEKAFRQRHQVFVRAASRAEAEQLDELLWTFRAESFIPHHLVGEGPTPPPPVRIGWDGIPAESRDVLINLHAEAVPEPGRCRRLLEIVGGGEDLREPARRRWAHYKRQGFDPVKIEL